MIINPGTPRVYCLRWQVIVENQVVVTRSEWKAKLIGRSISGVVNHRIIRIRSPGLVSGFADKEQIHLGIRTGLSGELALDMSVRCVCCYQNFEGSKLALLDREKLRHDMCYGSPD